MKKSCCIFLLCIVVMLICACGCNQKTLSGGDKDGVYWELKGGTLMISGKGDMYDFEYLINKHPGILLNLTNVAFEKPPYHNIRESVNKIIVEDGITSIGNRAFFEFG